MPRANRYLLPGQIYHVTHRCHDRAFLLKFARDRNAYRDMLRDRLDRFPLSLLGYCLTSNHTHLLLQVQGDEADVLPRFMQTLEGDFAQAYNLRKRRSGAYWSDRYHAVMVERGEYLWRCLRYIDLNMVRAGVVRTPRDWPWCSYQELAGLRHRYRVVDRDALAEALAPGHPFPETARHYRETVDNALRAGDLVREPWWTESLAVGGEGYVRDLGKRIPRRMAVETRREGNLWLVHESPAPYGSFSAAENAANTPNQPFSHQ